MLNRKEHNQFLNKVKEKGVNSNYPTTLFGNYKPETVVSIVADMLESYRIAQIVKLKKNTHDD
jgi:hypothetical protein